LSDGLSGASRQTDQERNVMSAVDVKAYLINEDFRMSYIVEYWRTKWENSHDIAHYDMYQYHLTRYKYFLEFRKAVFACFDISE